MCYSELLDSSGLDMLFSTAGQELLGYAIQHCWTAVVWICYSALQDSSCCTAVV